MPSVDPAMFILSLVVILLALTVHEFAHAWVADAAGDPTPASMGRVTLNPLRHLDPLGTIMLIITSLTGFGIGWGKPVMVNPSKMRNPRWDHFLSVAAGPLSNLLQAGLFSIVLRLVGIGSRSGLLTMGDGGNHWLVMFLVLGVIINVGLFCFNLIPLGPLDGHWLVGAFLPETQRWNWYKFNRSYGSFIFIALILVPSGSPFDVIGMYLRPAVTKIAGLLIGVPL